MKKKFSIIDSNLDRWEYETYSPLHAFYLFQVESFTRPITGVLETITDGETCWKIKELVVELEQTVCDDVLLEYSKV